MTNINLRTSGHLVFVLVCDISTVIQVIHAKITTAVAIHHEVYVFMARLLWVKEI